MQASPSPDVAAWSLDPFVNAFKHCRAAAPCLADWIEYWQGKTTIRPVQELSYHLNPETSRLFGTLRRFVKSIRRDGELPSDVNSAEPLLSELKVVLGRLRSVFGKKSLSNHAKEDVATLTAVESRLAVMEAALAANKSSRNYVRNVRDSLSQFIEIAGALNAIIERREAIVNGREPDEAFPQVELGRYAKSFIRFADQNVGVLIFKDKSIGCFYINRAAKSTWNYLRPMLAAMSADGWVVIEGNVRHGFGRTTAGNDVEQDSDVVRLGRHVHSRQRGHTSKHEWRISTELYQQTSHTE